MAKNTQNATRFKNALAKEILSWNAGIIVKKESPLGLRFVSTTRKIDLVLKYGEENKCMGIEAKIQETEGTTYQKLSYSLDDCKVCPIPTIIVFAGVGIKDDLKSKMIVSGYGIEVEFIEGPTAEDDKIVDRDKLFRQRVYITLGLDWLSLYPYLK